jgi:hypothetical protein
VAQDERGPDLRPQPIERALDQLAASDVVGGVPVHRRLDGSDRGPPEQRQRQPADPPAPELVEREVDDDPVQPALERALAVVLVPALPGAGERVVGRVERLVRVAQDAVGDAVHVVCVVAVGLIGGAIAPAVGHGLPTPCFGQTLRRQACPGAAS